MFGNYNAYQPVGTQQQFAMDQMQQFQQRAQMQPGMQQGMQLIRVTGMDGQRHTKCLPTPSCPCSTQIMTSCMLKARMVPVFRPSVLLHFSRSKTSRNRCSNT
nr:MAG TPA: hypothetical protein [Caudoviricetes sp.]